MIFLLIISFITILTILGLLFAAIKESIKNEDLFHEGQIIAIFLTIGLLTTLYVIYQYTQLTYAT